VEAFWRNLRDGVESITFFEKNELREAGVEQALLEDERYIRACPMLEGIDLFDAPFFGYVPREAELMDPQHRLFLECAYESLEDAGYDPGAYPGRIGVFGATNMSTYLLANLGVGDVSRLVEDVELLIGNDKDYLTTRVSYKLNLRGPSINVNSACSSSLVAICLACESLLNYRCDMVLAGGAAVSVPQKTGYLYRDVAGGLSPDGHCRAFDAKAAGTVFGSGLGIVVLKRLAEAAADRDAIRAVIRGYAVNNDGCAKVGYMAPSVDRHADAVREALIMAEVKPESIGYIEAHGTGTALGDPIEIAALTRAFEGVPSGVCAIGSVKTNIGHLTSAAGVAGFIKTVLALQHRKLPPSLNFETLNPRIDFSRSPFFVNTRLREWASNGDTRRAGISALGVGGTNAHIILEEAPERAPEPSSRPAHLLVVSARSPEALANSCEALASRLASAGAPPLADAAYTLHAGRKPFEHRKAVVCATPDEAAELLRAGSGRGVATGVARAESRPVVFLFAGAGSSTTARNLADVEPLFAAELNGCLSHADPDLRREMEAVLAGAAVPMCARTALPALLAYECALARFWMTLGVRPTVVLGHSLGEYAAAVTAGLLQLADAFAAVTLRGSLLDRLPPGAMLTAGLSAAALEPLLGGHMSVAAVNGPELCMVSGLIEEIDSLEQELRKRGALHLRSPISGAAHSHLVDPVLDEFAAFMKSIPPRPAAIPMISCLTADWIRAGQALEASHWVRHMRQTALFSQALEKALGEDGAALLEIGPDQTLTSLVRRHPALAAGHVLAPSSPAAGSRQPANRYLLEAAGKLWVSGVTFGWHHLYRHEKRGRVPLPTYPFERQRYWIEPAKREAAAKAMRRTITRQSPDQWFYAPLWRETPLTKPASVRDPQSWLVLEDALGIGGAVTRLLTDRGHRVTSVNAGPRFERSGAATFQVNPARSEDYEALIRELSADGMLPARLVHMWGTTNDAVSDLAWSRIEAQQELGLYSIVHLCRAFGSRLPLHVSLITSGAQRATGEERLAPGKATAFASVGVMRRERIGAVCRSIDIAAPEGLARKERLARLLADELDSAASEPMVAYRGGKRWVRDFGRIPPGTEPASAILRPRGVYLITGGLGRVGLSLAERLATNFQARLVLTSRAPLPEREQWDGAALCEDATGYRIRRIRELESAAGEVMIRSADAGDQEQMAGVVAEAEAAFGPINGVFHMAADIDRDSFHLMTETTIAHCRRQLRAKLDGALVLHSLFAQRSPDFLVFSSSLASIFGGMGNFAYSAANLFLDSLAHHLAGSAFPCISINWDAWKLAGAPGDYRDGPARSTLDLVLSDLPMSADEGLDALTRILEMRDVPQVLVSTGDLHARLAQLDDARALSAGQPKQRYRRPAVAMPPVPPTTETERELVRLWQDVLSLEGIGVQDNFFEIGGDSLLAVRLIGRVQETLGIEIPLRRVVEEPTIAGIARVIDEVRSGAAAKTAPSLMMPLRPASLPDAVSLVCVPYAGGTPIVYNALAERIPGWLAVHAVDLPGHDLGSTEPMRPLEEMIDECAAHVRASVPGPVAVYGHCGGSLVAVELARRLEAVGMDVRAVYTGAALPPGGEQMAQFASVDDLARIPDTFLHAFLQQLGGFDGESDPVRVKFILDGFRHDALEQWKYYERLRANGGAAKLRAPLIAIVGDADPLTQGFETRWREWEHFAASVRLEVVPGGGHYFIKSHTNHVARLIAADEALLRAGKASGAATGSPE
jgi:acyl transferase domain-containing protein/surfactin synthase thioesterase subunit/acyl carrier protein